MEEENDKISNSEILYKQIAKLYMSTKCSDIVLVVEDNKIPAHTSIVGANCEYFEKLFSSGLSESYQTEIKLEVPFEAFKIILKYFYTGEIILSNITDIEIMIQIVDLIEKYCLFNLKDNFENYFIKILSAENSCRLLEIARLYKLNKLESKSIDLIQKYPDNILESESFSKIPKELLEEILTNELFFPSSELGIFYAVKKWSEEENRNIETVLHLVDLPKIPSGKLFEIRNLGTLTDTKLFDAIGKQLSEIPLCSEIRKPNINVATSTYNARTIQGYLNLELLNNGNVKSYDDTKGYTRHTIDKKNNLGIIVELGRIFNINNIQMLLWDCDNRTYSYFIEISTDQRKWERIIDYSSYKCRSWQHLYFPVKHVKYIKIVGTNCSKNNYFDIVTLEAYYRETIPEIKDGLVVPEDNVALVCMGATVLEAQDWCDDANDMINGDPNYGYTMGYDNQPILMRLSQPYHISSMAILIKNHSGYYESERITIQTSLNSNNWSEEEVVNSESNVLQPYHFNSRPVLFIKILTEAYNIKVQHFECPYQIKE